MSLPRYSFVRETFPQRIINYQNSEAKFIFNFIRKHLHTADEFIIETKNIYFTCTSCQRELLMLQDYATGLGKKVEIIIHGDESIIRATQ